MFIFEYCKTSQHLSFMKNLTTLALAFVLVGVMLYAGVNGIIREHSYGSFFVFLAICTATGLAFDVTRLVRQRIRKSNIRRFGR
jgi:hypothetical protein